jgi:hypothetical protein
MMGAFNWVYIRFEEAKMRRQSWKCDRLSGDIGAYGPLS